MRYAAFLRAINVGGHVVKMDRLRKVFEAAGFSDVETVINSGNVVFRSPKRSGDAMARTLETRLEKTLGYAVATFVRSEPELAAIAAREPFGPLTLAPPASLFIGFLKSPTTGEAARQVAALSNDVDTLVADGREIYWLARKAFSGSTISYGVVEKLLRTQATFRNVNTVRRIAAKYCGS